MKRMLLPVICIALAFALLLGSASEVQAFVYSDWPDWIGKKRKLKIWVDPSLPLKAKAAIAAAIDGWNEANAENGCEYEFSSDGVAEQDADIKMQRTDDTSFSGAFTPTFGKDGSGNDCITSGEMKISSALWVNTVGYIQHIIMHELGHAMRLAHSRDSDCVMYWSPNGVTEPSAEDLDEAKDSDNAYCINGLLPLNGLQRGVDDQVLELVPDPRFGASLDGVVTATISCVTGGELSGTVVWIGPEVLEASVDAGLAADHNEVLIVTLTYGDESVAECPAIVTVNDELPVPGTMPHAVAGEDLVVGVGEKIELDGSTSYHDDPSEFLVATWIITLEGGETAVATTSLVSTLADLPVGTHTAVLSVIDWHGRSSQDSVTVTVTP